MRFNTLNDWLSWQETLHPTEIELGLERVSQVLERLELNQPDFTLITVAGTNGKGSSVAMLESILLAAGYRVGTYTSPHLLRYNERIKLDGQPVSDAVLCESFQRIDEARLAVPGADISLSYFEFGTLAAIDILQRSGVDIAILEVGLGGRLDAVNVLDADVALITAIDVDHADWLGDDRETIAVEKAGILRPGRPAVCSDPQPPASLSATAESLGVSLVQLGTDFFAEQKGDEWQWRNPPRCVDHLPLPALCGDFQLHNAAGVLAVLAAVEAEFPVSDEEIAQGLQSVSLPGRFQIQQGAPVRIFDVAHNEQSARALAKNLSQAEHSGQTYTIFAMLADKDIRAVVAQLGPLVNHWYLAPLPVPRAASVAQLQSALADESIPVDAMPSDSIRIFDDVNAAFQAALAASTAQDRIVVTGSFYTVAAVLGETV
jgi:dihydrofolate synthase/folylpolyglutamate synthase